jgi:transposase InsO family protein
MKFAFIAKHRSIWPVAWLCEALGVSRSGFHAWLNRSPSDHSRYDEVLLDKIGQSFKASDRTYGARRVWHDVLTEDLSCGLHRIERLMRQNALRATSARPAERCGRPICYHAECAGSPVRSRQTEPEMGGRLHLYLDGRRLALCCRRHRPVLTPCRRLIDEYEHDGAAGHRCPHHGHMTQRKALRGQRTSPRPCRVVRQELSARRRWPYPAIAAGA